MAGKKLKKTAAPKREKTAEEIAHDKERAKGGWKRRERPPINKWEKGVEVSGTLIEVREGQFGPLIDLKDEEGVVRTYGGPTMLAGLLKGIEPGTEILIECIGKIKTTRGQDAWEFRVYERETEDEAGVPFD